MAAPSRRRSAPNEDRLAPPRLPSMCEMARKVSMSHTPMLPSQLVAAASTGAADAVAEHGPSRPLARDMTANLRRSRHRDREKRDTMFLRAYCAALEAELERLRRTQEDRRRLQHDDDHVDPSARSPRTTLWRALALKRREERKASERESERLRALSAAQVALMAQMQQYLAIHRGVGPASSASGARVTLSDGDTELMAALLSELDGVCRSSGGVMEECGLASLPEADYSCIRSRGRSVAADGEPARPEEVDVISVTQLRGSFSSLQSVLWTDVIAQLATNGGVHFDLGEKLQRNTMAMKLRHFQENRDNRTLCIEAVSVSRRYETSPECITVVWRCLCMGKGDVSNITAVESGFVVARPSVCQPDLYTLRRYRRLETMQKPTTLMYQLEGGASADEAVEKFKDMSVSAIEDEISTILGKVAV